MIFRFNITETISVKDFLIKEKIPSNVISSLKGTNGQILVNDQTVTSIYEMHNGDLLELVFPSSSQGENITSVMGDFKILYEDSYLLIIDKENNIATIPTRKHYDHSLANYVMSYYKRKGIMANIHFINRLDAPTSGIIMLAKNSYMLTLMQKTNIEKYYLLEVEGCFNSDSGVIETGIVKDPNSIIKRMVTNEFINSKTIYKLIKKSNSSSVVEALLVTGKTHQLRLHFSNMGYPILGDALYCESRYTNDDILHLHSYKVSFIHPITKQKIELITYPTWFKKLP